MSTQKTDIHKPTDEYNETWDLSGIKQTSEILYELGYNLTNSTEWPNWYDGTEFKAIRSENAINLRVAHANSYLHEMGE